MINKPKKLFRIKIITGKPKRRSGVYVAVLHWGIHGASIRKDEGCIVDLKEFQQFQLEEGPDIYDGLEYKLIPY